MLLAIKDQDKIDAVKVDSVLATEIIARALGKYLDDGEFNIADEVRNPAGAIYKSYTGLDEREFFEVRHDKRITRDPLHRFDPVISYNALEYILFDNDANKIIIPDFYDYDNDFPLYTTSELDSFYSAYTHAGTLNRQYKPLDMAYKNQWVLVEPQIKHHHLELSLISSTFQFREFKPKSEIMSLDYCYCCGTFECKCTDEQLLEFTKELPF